MKYFLSQKAEDDLEEIWYSLDVGRWMLDAKKTSKF